MCTKKRAGERRATSIRPFFFSPLFFFFFLSLVPSFTFNAPGSFFHGLQNSQLECLRAAAATAAPQPMPGARSLLVFASAGDHWLYGVGERDAEKTVGLVTLFKVVYSVEQSGSRLGPSSLAPASGDFWNMNMKEHAGH